MTLGELLDALNTEKPGCKCQNTMVDNIHSLKEYMNASECAVLTGYSPDYIRQLVFKRQIPFHKRADRKPVRFKREEIAEWMAGKKYSPITDMADDYIAKSPQIRR